MAKIERLVIRVVLKLGTARLGCYSPLDSAPRHGPRMGGADDDLPWTVRVHRCARLHGRSQ